jgi:hypothetical protein
VECVGDNHPLIVLNKIGCIFTLVYGYWKYHEIGVLIFILHYVLIQTLKCGMCLKQPPLHIAFIGCILLRKKKCFKNKMSVIWSWTYFYNLHWNNYLYSKGSLYIWEEMIMMALLHMASLENSECIWKIQRKPEVTVSVSMTEK